MRLTTFLPPGSDVPRAGEVRDDEVVAFAAKRETVLERLRAGDRDPALGEAYPLAEVTLLAPVPRPRAIFGIGLNYAAHAAEQGKQPPEFPIVFMKLPSSSAPPNAAVACPPVVRRLDYEGELVVVMGSEGTIAGYAVADDVSARDLQRREPQWTTPATCASRRTSTASCARTPRRATSSSARSSSSTSSRRRARSSPAT
jgi:acylpyruvate hydrolase